MVGPFVEVGGDIRKLPDPRARVITRGDSWLRAAWPDGVEATLRARRSGRGAALDCSVSSERAVVIGALGVHVDGMAATRLLVEGFHSWEWSGVRDARADGRGWWGGIWGTPGGAQTAIALEAPPRLGPLLLRWHAGQSFAAFTVGAPPQLQHTTGEPPLLTHALAAGAVLRGDPIRMTPVDRRSATGAGLPRLRPGDRRPGPRTAGWMSWNCLGVEATAGDVVDAAHALTPPGGTVLLDDGWMSAWGDWIERDDFDSTVAGLAEAVHAAGRRLCVWIAPFMVDPRSRTAAQRSALLLRDADGQPVLAERGPRPHLVLDASQRATRAHLAALGRRLGAAGVDALKLDFLYAGALPGVRSGAVSDIAALRIGVDALTRAFRSAAPRGSRIYACGAPAAPLVGLVDACRSGEDSVLNVPNDRTAAPAPPTFVHGEAVIRAQARNLAARAWLWGTTVPPDVDAVTLAQVAGTEPPDERCSRMWLELARRGGGPLLDADVPDGRLGGARLRAMRRAQQLALGRPPRPQRPDDPLSGSAVSGDDAAFLDWPEQLPDGAEL